MRLHRPLPLFVFGTLRDSEVLGVVLDRDVAALPTRPAWLDGHVTVTLPGESYPVLRSVAGASAEGLLLDGLDCADFERITFFEGDEYALEETHVRTATAPRVPALLCAERSTRTGPRTRWSLGDWQHHHRAAFLETAREYMALYGRATITEADAVWQRSRGGGV